VLGTRAPDTNKLRLPVLDGRPSIVVFLRHCGCPCMFAGILNGRKEGSQLMTCSCRENLPRAPSTGEQIPTPQFHSRFTQLPKSH
jgi:hypothetical protein